MADVSQNTLEAIRAVLIGDGALTAIVAATEIGMQDNPYPAAYPAITLAQSGSSGASVIAKVEFGTLYLRMYYQGDSPYTNLLPIRARVRELLNVEDSWESVSDADVEVHEIYEYSGGKVMVENEADMQNVYSLNTQYAYTAVNK